MRILMIIDGLPGGGAERMLLTLTKGLLSQGHQVSVFSLRSICDYSIPEGVEYKIITDYTRTPWSKITELARRARSLDKVVQASQKISGEFNLIVSHLHKTDRIVARSLVLQHDRIWFCLHTMFSLGYLGRRQGIARWLKRKQIRNVYQNRNLIAVSHEVLKDIQQNCNVTPRRAVIIYNPFDFAVIRKLARVPCDLAGQDYLIHVGRFHENKRQDRLLKAYAKSGIKAPLVILGKGSDIILQQLQSIAHNLQITNRVLFKTFNNNPYPYINHARMLILSSDSEGFGNVLVEALICQTPVVSTRCPGGPIEILSGELSAGLSEMNITSLAETIQMIYHHPPTINISCIMPYEIDNICQQYVALASCK